MNRMGLVGIALALVGVAVLVGYAQTASAIDTGEKFTLVAPVTDERGAQRPELGDRFVFGAPLQNRAGDERAQSHRWGSARQRSTPAGDAEQNRQQCVVTATIGTTNGETEIELQAVGRVLAEDVLFR
jgi:hypothetical protein